jgi:uncharacterized membrane protein YqjE
MKTFLWFLFIALLSGFAIWVVVGPWFPKNPVIILALAAFFTIPNIGAIWMLYVSIRSEQHPLPFVALALIPYSFLWYYFERVRHGKHKSRTSLATG